MKKYIKYTESNGQKIEKEYSDEAVIKILRQQETQGKNYKQMAVMFGLDFDRKNVDILKIVFFNDRPADKNAFTIYIADTNILIDKTELSAFGTHIEKLLINTFPEKYLYSQKEQMHVMIQRLFSDFAEDDKSDNKSGDKSGDKSSFKSSKRKKDNASGGSAKDFISSLFADFDVDKALDVDYRNEKAIDSYSPVNEVRDLPYDDEILLLELEEDIEYLGKRLESIKVSIQSGGFSEEYDDCLYSIIIQMNQLHKDEYCEIDIKEFLEKHDGIEKIQQTARYIGDVISKEWPKTNVFVDCTVKRQE